MHTEQLKSNAIKYIKNAIETRFVENRIFPLLTKKQVLIKKITKGPSLYMWKQ